MKKKIKYIILLFIVLGIFSKFVETSQDEFTLKDVFISEYDSIKDGEKYITQKNDCKLTIMGQPKTDSGKIVYLSIKPENEEYETNEKLRLDSSGDADWTLNLKENKDYKIDAYTDLKGNKPKKDAKPVKTINVRFDKKAYLKLDQMNKQIKEEKEKAEKEKQSQKERENLISKEDFEKYNSIMDKLNSQPDRSEDEIFNEIAPQYGTTGPELKKWMSENSSKAIAAESIYGKYKAPTVKNNENVGNDAIKSVYENKIREVYKDNAYVSATMKNGIYTINLYPKGDFKDAIIHLQADHISKVDSELGDVWITYTDAVKKLSKTINQDINQDVCINVINPMNEENVLYSSMNGIEIYNFTKN